MIWDKGNWVLHVIDPPPISSSEILPKAWNINKMDMWPSSACHQFLQFAWLIKLNYVSFMPV
jgi:hypothetical protein